MTVCPDTMTLLQSDDVDQIREGCFAAGETKCLEALPFLVQHLQSENLGVQEAADEALRRIPSPEAVRALAPLLSSDDAPLRNLAMDLLREISQEDLDTCIVMLKSEDGDLRIFMADILGSSESPLAVGPLCDALLKDPDVNVRYQAAVSLGALGFSEAAPCLTKALQQDEEWVQFSVIEAITKIRDDSAVEALAKSLDNATDLVASMIVEALGEMGSMKAAVLLLRRMDAATPALRSKFVKAVVNILGAKSMAMLSEADRTRIHKYSLEALEDEDTDIQDAAIQALSYVGGDDATQAILRLGGALDPVVDQERLEQLAGALAGIGYGPALEVSVREGSWKEGMLAVNTIRLIGDPAAIGLLVDEFWNKDQDMQRNIMSAMQTLTAALAETGSADTASLTSFLMDLLERHKDATVIKGAIHILGPILRHAPAVDTMFAFLEHPFDDVKDAALDACVAINGPRVLERFRELFHSTVMMNRLMAVYVFSRTNVEESLDQLREALEDPAPEVRKLALEGLRSVCESMDTLIPAVLGRLSDENREVRLAVVEVLGQCCMDVTAYLEQALHDEDDWVKVRALEALAQRRDLDSVRFIAPFVQHENTLVAIKAVEALGDIGGESAFRALLEALTSDNPDVAAAAEAAVDRFKSEEGEL
ncbi:HEAT repeat domain-containing protein [Megalodesulfovibrio paquesii]